MNASLRSSPWRPRPLDALLLPAALLASLLALGAACGDSDEGQTPVCPENPTEGEECFTAPGTQGTAGASGSGGSGQSGSSGQAGEAGAGGEAGAAGEAGSGG